MCRGLAVLMNKSGKIICKGMSSHSETSGYSSRIEDDCLKYEVIVTDRNKQGYRVEVDEQIEKNDNRYKETVACLPEIKKWCKLNELKVLRWLLFNQSYADRKGNKDSYHQKIGGNVYSYHQKIGGNVYSYHQKISGDKNSSCQKIGGNKNSSWQEIGKEYYIGLTVLNKYPNTTAIIKKARYNWNLTLPELVRYCAENSEKVLKELGKEGKME